MTRVRRSRPRLPAGVVSGAVAMAATVGAALLLLPLVALLARAPWEGLGRAATDPGMRTALRLSLVTSLAATGLATVVGLPLAWVLARWRVPGRRLLRGLVLLPLVLPPVVGGAALLLAFGRAGLLGRPLGALGVTLPFSTAGAVLAEAFVALPFLVLAAEAGFRGVDRRAEDAARTLGAAPGRVFRRVTLPLAAPALGAGALLAWARALGEFGATITFAGNTPGRTTTVPLQVYLLLESGDADGAVALSVVLLAASVLVIVLLRDRWLGVR